MKNKAGSIALESIAGHFDDVNGICGYFRGTHGPMGLELDEEQIKIPCSKIAAMLRLN